MRFRKADHLYMSFKCLLFFWLLLLEAGEETAENFGLAQELSQR